MYGSLPIKIFDGSFGGSWIRQINVEKKLLKITNQILADLQVKMYVASSFKVNA